MDLCYGLCSPERGTPSAMEKSHPEARVGAGEAVCIGDDPYTDF